MFAIFLNPRRNRMKKVSGFFLAHRLGSGQVEIGADMIESWRIPVQAKQEGSWCKQRRRTEKCQQLGCVLQKETVVEHLRKKLQGKT